ncbi:MAG: DUF1549 domain-containing protein, partial [Candidatus Latescibacteria bacterium]|nr:DUF1549 domain-containing protein [Candidatus Latescibacterota bacterium]
MRSQILAIGLTLALAGPATGNQAVVGPFESRATVEPGGRIDELVFGRLRDLDIQPANLCSDAVFLRRVYLDVIGTLPTAREARRFLRDRNPEKRRVLVDHLLGRE